MNHNIKGGVAAGDEVQEIFKLAKAKKFALPAVNVIGSNSINGVLETAAKLNAPVIIQFSNGGAVFNAGKGLDNDNQRAAIRGAIAGAKHVHEISKAYDVPVILHTDHAAKKLLPDMLKRGSGYFVNTASAAGLLSHIDSITYSTTKHAAIGLAEWLAITYGKKGIGVSILCPQAVETDMTKGRENEVSALDGMMKPEDVAVEVIKAIKDEIFLISPHEEVIGYFQNKANNYSRWIGGMQKLKERLNKT